MFSSILDRFSSAEPIESYPLHKAVFQNDSKNFDTLLKTDIDINKQDPHGNTALHLAIILGHKKMIEKLLDCGALTRIKNNGGWNCFVESISYGDRGTIANIYNLNKAESFEQLLARKPNFLKMLNDLGDFYLEIKWEFHTWCWFFLYKKFNDGNCLMEHSGSVNFSKMPLISRFLPSDTCKLYKRGSSIRVDTTLLDFNEHSWTRGDLTFLFNPEAKRPGEQLVLMDNNKKCYQKFNKNAMATDSKSLNEQLDSIMSNDIMTLHISTKNVRFNPTMAGWFTRYEKFEKIGGYQTKCYSLEGLNLVTRKRREHLSHEDVKQNKALIKDLFSGTLASNNNSSIYDDETYRNRKSLQPPPKPIINWAQYLQASNKNLQVIGRPHVTKTVIKEYKASIAMCEDFPLPKSVLTEIFEVVSFKQIEKLKEFFDCRLPPGFPIKLEVPLIPTVSANVTFQKFEWRTDFNPKFFTIPRGYAEEPQNYGKSDEGYSDNQIEDVNQRSLLYIQESSLHNREANNSRGMVMSQLLKFMGYQEELWRPDAPSYIQPITTLALEDQPKQVKFSNEQLQWPFDPESVTIPSKTRHTHHLTTYCQARSNADIGAGQRTGLLTRWDTVKLNSMYCPQQVGYADPRLGPCVLPRHRKQHNRT